ncbi:MAG: hypothetical protein HKN68_08455 [Saprospiraceae bacterium]|nr:hypothetical protein [Saprospiraceae bacterium]
MDQCVAELDFDGVKAFREPLFYTQRKLNVLKCLENPNYDKISRLTRMISRMEKSLNERKFENDYLDEQTRQKVDKRFNESMKNIIEKSKNELEELQSIVPEQIIDDDKILELFEGLERNEINGVEFEIKKDKIFLQLNVNSEHAEFTFRTSDNVNLEHHLVKPSKSILGKLGFNTATFKK